MEGIILKALSGFYYVDCDGSILTCRGRGKLRHGGFGRRRGIRYGPGRRQRNDR